MHACVRIECRRSCFMFFHFEGRVDASVPGSRDTGSSCILAQGVFTVVRATLQVPPSSQPLSVLYSTSCGLRGACTAPPAPSRAAPHVHTTSRRRHVRAAWVGTRCLEPPIVYRVCVGIPCGLGVLTWTPHNTGSSRFYHTSNTLLSGSMFESPVPVRINCFGILDAICCSSTGYTRSCMRAAGATV